MATKKDLIENITKKLNYLDSDDSKYIVECVLNYLKSELEKGNRVEVRGFGSMSIRKRKYANKDDHYNSIYYRMSKNVQESL